MVRYLWYKEMPAIGKFPMSKRTGRIGAAKARI